MRTVVRWSLLLAALATTAYLSHRYWPSHAEARLTVQADAGSSGRGSAAAPPWSTQGFRDAEGCDTCCDKPGCY